MSSLPLQFLLLTIGGWMKRDHRKVVAYLLAEDEVLRERLRGRRIRFSDAQRRRLARAAKALGRQGLSKLDTLVTPDTLLRWYRKLVAKKYDGTGLRDPTRSRRTTDVVELIIRVAHENPTWGYTRIRGALSNLGHELGRTTIKRILIEAGIDPARKRGKTLSWSAFLRAHWGAIARSRPWVSSPSRCCPSSGWFAITFSSSSIWPAAAWRSLASYASRTTPGCGRSRAT